jgi:hypothetical protein
MSKGGEREILEEKYHKHEDRGRIPKGRYPFPLMSKGERNIDEKDKYMRRKSHRGSMSVSINAKGGYCW